MVSGAQGDENLIKNSLEAFQQQADKIQQAGGNFANYDIVKKEGTYSLQEVSWGGRLLRYLFGHDATEKVKLINELFKNLTDTIKVLPDNIGTEPNQASPIAIRRHLIALLKSTEGYKIDKYIQEKTKDFLYALPQVLQKNKKTINEITLRYEALSEGEITLDTIREKLDIIDNLKSGLSTQQNDAIKTSTEFKNFQEKLTTKVIAYYKDVSKTEMSLEDMVKKHDTIDKLQSGLPKQQKDAIKNSPEFKNFQPHLAKKVIAHYKDLSKTEMPLEGMVNKLDIINKLRSILSEQQQQDIDNNPEFQKIQQRLIHNCTISLDSAISALSQEKPALETVLMEHITKIQKLFSTLSNGNQQTLRNDNKFQAKIATLASKLHDYCIKGSSESSSKIRLEVLRRKKIFLTNYATQLSESQKQKESYKKYDVLIQKWATKISDIEAALKTFGRAATESTTINGDSIQKDESFTNLTASEAQPNGLGLTEQSPFFQLAQVAYIAEQLKKSLKETWSSASDNQIEQAVADMLTSGAIDYNPVSSFSKYLELYSMMSNMAEHPQIAQREPIQ